MSVSRKLIRASRVMAWLSILGAALYLLGEIAVFIVPDSMKLANILETHHTGVAITSAIPLANRLGALAVELIPTALLIWALLELYGLFHCYSAGEVFTPEPLARLNRVAALMFWYVLVSFIAQAPVSLILSWANAGHRAISLGLSSHDLSVLFVAGVALVIARVMAEARRMADENASFV